MSRRLGLIGLAAAALLAGCASSGAPFAAGPDVLPGQPVVELIGEPETIELTADRTFGLEDAPAEATHVRVTVQCTSPGITWFGTDPEGNDPSIQCTEADVASSADTTWTDVEFEPGDVLSVRFSPGATSTVSVQFAHHTPTDWGVNADGETYGVPAEDGTEPDLLAAHGTTADGREIVGYVRTSDLEEPAPSSPEEAVAQQAEREAQGVTGWDIPLYDSDGRTIIGTFRVGS